MQQRFEKFICQEHLFPDGGQVLLAVSGGRDSVTLCHLVASAGIPFAVAHCNFHLRPVDCDRDEAFVRRLADGYGVPCFVAQFDTLAYAAENHLSVEEAARNLRYAFFEQVRLEQGLSVIATAHHRDDAIETFFINLLRGTGLTGLRGIPLRNGNIVRPLLPFGRDEIDDYIRRNALDYVDDATNSQPLYLRNRIRLQLMPLLRSLAPSFDSTMQSTLQHLADADTVYRSAMQSMRDALLKPDGNGYAVDVAALRSLDPLSTCLFELLRPFGFSSAVAAEVADALDAQSGKQFLSPTHRIVKDRDRLLIVPLAEPSAAEYPVADVGALSMLPLPLHCSVAPNDSNTIRLPHSEAWFDLDRVHFPLTLRRWRSGDRFVPFGMKGSRLVSDLLSDLKLSLPDKERVWLLCDADGSVLWVVGLRASALAPVTRTTASVLRLRCALFEK